MSELLKDGEVIERTDPPDELLDKLQAIDQELREETGGVVLFALFEREGAPGQWDVLVAADWIGSDITPSVAYVAGKIQEGLDPDELVLLTSVVPLRSSDPSIRQLLAHTAAEHGKRQIKNFTFNGIPVSRAWIFTSDLNGRSSFVPPPYKVDQQVSAKARRFTLE